MKNFWSYASTVLISSGIGATVMFGLSKWLGGIWSNRILENERQKNRKAIEKNKQEFQKEIECIKEEFQKEFSKIDKLNEKAIYISKTQYDKEFEIYQDIWSKLYQCTKSTLGLCAIIEDVPTSENAKDMYYIDKYNNFSKKINEFEDAINKFLPFYKEDFGVKFNKLKGYCDQVGVIYKIYKIDVKHNESFRACRDFIMPEDRVKEFYEILPKKISEIQKEIANDIREYLYSLQII